MKFTLDSNVLVDAIRTPSGYEALDAFMRWARYHVFLSSVVVAELEAGARTASSRTQLDERFLAAFEARKRIVAPTEIEWRRAGRVLGESSGTTAPVPKLNDALLAVQARNLGWVVITRDRGFGELRARIPGLQLMTPFPMPHRP